MTKLFVEDLGWVGGCCRASVEHLGETCGHVLLGLSLLGCCRFWYFLPSERTNIDVGMDLFDKS